MPRNNLLHLCALLLTALATTSPYMYSFAGGALPPTLMVSGHGVATGSPDRPIQHADQPVRQSGFEENKGQVRTTGGDPAAFVRFRLSEGGTSIFLLNDGIAYQFSRMHYPEGFAALEAEAMNDPGKQMELDALREHARLETYRMDMRLEDANPNPRITTEGRSSDYTNYYTHDVLDVRTYTKVIYHDVYPGIDWVAYTSTKGFKYDFIVHPGADPDRIRLRFKHHEELYVDANGDLIHGNRMGRFTEKRPESFQGGKEIATRFVLERDVLRFAVGSYDRSLPLTIDPARLWGTYYGGTDTDRGHSCAVDANGNVFLTGWAHSTSGIADGGHQNTFGGSGFFSGDAFLVKFNAAGIRLWGTYYGGSDFDYSFSCAVDASGNVFMAGHTISPNNIAANGHQGTLGGSTNNSDAFLVKFDPDGTRLWGTYYGGSNEDVGYSCAVDASGNVFMAGRTRSTIGIAANGHQNTHGGGIDAFLVKFDANGTRLWGTYYGGNDYDYGNACTTDTDGNVFMAGWTWSDTTTVIAEGGHQNTLSGAQYDGYLVKFDANGTRLWGTYYGGISALQGSRSSSCATDASGNVFMAGWTTSTTAIADNGHQNTFSGTGAGFLVKFDPGGVRLWGTYYGRTGTSCAVDANGYVFLSGSTTSTNGIAAGGHQNVLGGGSDTYLVKFSANGVRQWGTYYGGTGTDGHLGYTSCAVDSNGNSYLAGITNTPTSTAIAIDGHQNTFGGGYDAFLVKFDRGVFDCPILNANIGAPCDDGDPDTEHDTVADECVCAGTPFAIYDCPGLEANIGDPCDDSNPETENDTVNAECGCAGTPIVVYDCPGLEANIGDPCDDGDPNTENDTVNDECGCIGTAIHDCPTLEANIGAPCDDGDPDTENDTVDEECICAGELPSGIGEQTANTTLHPWPNPNPGGRLYVSLAGQLPGASIVLEILDLSGKQVAMRTLQPQGGQTHSVIDLNGELAAGLYMVRVRAGNAVHVGRLVIQP